MISRYLLTVKSFCCETFASVVFHLPEHNLEELIIGGRLDQAFRSEVLQ